MNVGIQLRSITATALLVLLSIFGFGTVSAAEKESYPEVNFPDNSNWGRNIQRTMRLLATSTQDKPNTVRILFYGQSITEQKWWRMVEEDLRKRFPHSHLIVANRALGGFSSQLLVKTAETDLYPFQPDLLIFHVYGAHDKYEDIIRRTRERTTAEILMQNDHVTKLADMAEETDASKLPPAGKHWDAFMNHNFLPSIAKKYNAELCDQRSLWKAYLKEHKLEPKALLSDNVHLNAHGEWFMAQCVKAYLRHDPKLGSSPAENWVKTLEVGSDVNWKDDLLKFPFTGSRIDLVLKQAPFNSAPIKIDNRKPSSFPELYGFTPALTQPPGKWLVKWPMVAPITSEAPLVLEDWTLHVQKDGGDENLFTFKLMGSVTGPDGEGRSDQKFVSNSKRIVIEPNAWNVQFSMALAGIKPVPEKFEVKWTVEPRFIDTLVADDKESNSTVHRATLFHGLPKGQHTLEIVGKDVPIKAVQLHTPPLADSASR